MRAGFRSRTGSFLAGVRFKKENIWRDFRRWRCFFLFVSAAKALLGRVDTLRYRGTKFGCYDHTWGRYPGTPSVYSVRQ